MAAVARTNKPLHRQLPRYVPLCRLLLLLLLAALLTGTYDDDLIDLKPNQSILLLDPTSAWTRRLMILSGIPHPSATHANPIEQVPSEAALENARRRRRLE